MGIGPGKGVFTAVKQPTPGLVSTDLSPVVNGGAVSSRDRIMKRYLCIAFIVASVLVVKSDGPSGFVAYAMTAQEKSDGPSGFVAYAMTAQEKSDGPSGFVAYAMTAQDK